MGFKEFYHKKYPDNKNWSSETKDETIEDVLERIFETIGEFIEFKIGEKLNGI